MQTNSRLAWNILCISLGCFLLVTSSSHGMFGEEYDPAKAQEAARLKAQQQGQRERDRTALDNQGNGSGAVQREVLGSGKGPSERPLEKIQKPAAYTLPPPPPQESAFDKQKKLTLANIQQQIAATREELAKHQTTRDDLQRQFDEHTQNVARLQKKVDDFKIGKLFYNLSPELRDLRAERDAAVANKTRFANSTSGSFTAAKNSITTLSSLISELEKEQTRIASSEDLIIVEQSQREAAILTEQRRQQEEAARAVALEQQLQHDLERRQQEEAARAVALEQQLQHDLAEAKAAALDLRKAFDLEKKMMESKYGSTYGSTYGEFFVRAGKQASCTSSRTDSDRGFPPSMPTAALKREAKVDEATSTSVSPEFDISALIAVEKSNIQKASLHEKYRTKMQQAEAAFSECSVFLMTERTKLRHAAIEAKLKFDYYSADLRFRRIHVDYLEALSKSSLAPEEKHEKYVQFDKAKKNAGRLEFRAYELEKSLIGASSSTKRRMDAELQYRKATAPQAEQQLQILLKEIQQWNTELREEIQPYQFVSSLTTAASTASAAAASAPVVAVESSSNLASSEDLKSLQSFAEKLKTSRFPDATEPSSEALEKELAGLQGFLDLNEEALGELEPEKTEPLMSLMREIEKREKEIEFLDLSNTDKAANLEQEITKLEQNFLLQLQAIFPST